MIVYQRRADGHTNDLDLGAFYLQNERIDRVTVYRIGPLPETPKVEATLTQPELFPAHEPEDLDATPIPPIKAVNIRGRRFLFHSDEVPSDNDVKSMEDFFAACRDGEGQDLRVVCVWPGNGALAGMVAHLSLPSTVFAITEDAAAFHEDNVIDYQEAGSLRIISGPPGKLAKEIPDDEEIDAVVFGSADREEDEAAVAAKWMAKCKPTGERAFIADWRNG